MREYHSFSCIRCLSLILLSSLLLISVHSSTASSNVTFDSSYSQNVFVESSTYTRFKIQFNLSRSVVYTNETNLYSLSISPQIQKDDGSWSSYITLKRVVISSIDLDFYEEAKETLSASTPLFAGYIQSGFKPLVISYGNTTIITGNFTFPDWWKQGTVQFGLYFSFSEELMVIDYGEHSTSNICHFPKIFDPILVKGFPSREEDLIFFSLKGFFIFSLVVITTIVISFFIRKFFQKNEFN